MYLGIQISITYLIASKVNLKYFNKKQINPWNILLIIIIGIGIFSGFRISTPDSLNVSEQFSDSFLIKSSKNVKQKIEKLKPYGINVVYQRIYKQLWKIEK